MYTKFNVKVRHVKLKRVQCIQGGGLWHGLRERKGCGPRDRETNREQDESRKKKEIEDKKIRARQRKRLEMGKEESESTKKRVQGREN